MSKFKAILCDIEGTTTDIDFVHKVLFPYADKYLESFLMSNRDNPEIHELITNISSIAKAEENLDLNFSGVVHKLHQWIKEDRKETNLKKIQGLIWEKGYKAGTLKSHLYPDVLPNWQKWADHKIKIAIYSSGSVHAQKMLFENSIDGDLTGFINHYFDTQIGPKRETTSYRLILDKLKVRPNECLFLSDIEQELDAAREAGLETVQLVRKDKIVSKHPQATTFDTIEIE